MRATGRALAGAAAMAVIATATASAAVFPVSDTPVTHAGPSPAYAVLDFDGDGYWDVIWLDDRLRLARGGSDGFTTAQSVELPVSGYVIDIAAAELTGDEQDDLVLTFGTPGTLVVVRGRADGRLQAPEPADRYVLRPPVLGYGRPTALDVGDIDGDGDRDVVAGIGVDQDTWYPPNETDNGEVVVLVNDGSGALSPSGQTLAVNAPIDVELVPVTASDLDLFVLQRNKPASQNLKRFAAAPGATFGSSGVYAGGELAWGDFNGDGFGDIVTAGGQLSIRPGPDLAQAIPIHGVSGSQLAVADLDADGRQDVYLARGDPVFYGAAVTPVFLHGTGSFAFTAVRGASTASQPAGEWRPTVVDLDGDGKLDIVSQGAVGAGSGLLVRFGLGPQLVPDPDHVLFDDQAVGTSSAARRVTFTNEGGGTASTIEADVIGDGPDFALDLRSCATATLQVDQSCSVDVRFAPTGGGLREADIALFAQDSAVGWGLSLAGHGFTPKPATSTPNRAATPAPTAAPKATPSPLRLAAPRIVGRVTLGTLRRHGLRLRQRFPGAGQARWTLETTSRSVLAPALRRITRARTVTVTLRLTARGRTTLTRQRPRRFALRTRFRDAAGRIAVRTTNITRTG